MTRTSGPSGRDPLLSGDIAIKRICGESEIGELGCFVFVALEWGTATVARD